MSNEYVMTISGIVFYLLKISLPDNSTVYVELLDVTARHSPAKKLAEQVITNAEKKQLSFDLLYKAADVLPDHHYEISARIETSGQVIYQTIKPHRVVLGVNHLRPEDVVVRPVREKPSIKF
ncbi:YbaY family lipoprotein [Rhodococcus sp. IEGM1300]